jgi:hypothetical protein
MVLNILATEADHGRRSWPTVNHFFTSVQKITVDCDISSKKKIAQLVVTGDKVYYKLFSFDVSSSLYGRFPRARLFASRYG